MADRPPEIAIVNRGNDQEAVLEMIARLEGFILSGPPVPLGVMLDALVSQALRLAVAGLGIAGARQMVETLQESLPRFEALVRAAQSDPQGRA